VRVLATYAYEVESEKVPEFMTWIGAAVAPRFEGRNTHESLRLATSPGSDGHVRITLDYDYPSRAHYDARLGFECDDPAWQAHHSDGAGWRLISIEAMEGGSQ
jgi:hypothetical protein